MAPKRGDAQPGPRPRAPNKLSRARRALTNLYRGFAYGMAVMRDPITSAAAFVGVQARMRARATAFLDTIERGIFANPDSPYRALLDAAAFDFARVRALVLEHGVEAALGRLCQHGVYVSIEEFKGLREARRGASSFRLREGDFRNPLASSRPSQSSLVMISGGTRSAGIQTAVSPAVQRMHAQHLAVALATYGAEAVPIVSWYPQMERTGLLQVTKLAALRHPPEAWISQIPGRRFSDVDESHAFCVGIALAARLCGLRLPRRTYLPFAEEAGALPWIAERSGQSGCVIMTIPSAALRLALAARQRGARLDHVTFITGAEALTRPKAAALEALGARVRSLFAFSEFGVAAFGCPSPASPDDMHVCKDAVAVVPRRRAADYLGNEVDALLFTSLRPEARRILLNMETGDYGKITQRACGCGFERVGWTDHLEDVRSFEKLNLESWAFLGSKLVSLVEEILPARFGGGPTDYQLVEQEDGDGQTRLEALVHPRLGPIDEEAVLACVETALDVAPAWADARVYRRLKTLQVRRAAPMMTRAGKVTPLHHLGSAQAADAPATITT